MSSMATTQGKGKGKKNKGVTVSLQTLLSEDSSAPQGFNVVNTPRLDWAQSMENEEIDDTFTLHTKRDTSKVFLPTAPKSTRGPDVDLSKVPVNPPFKAYLGNLPYDVTEHDINRYFSKLNIIGVRVPMTTGRPRGFAYAEFQDRQSLIDALTMNGDTFRNRNLRVGLPGDNDGNTRENNREEKQDRTAGDWRSAPREEPNNSTRDATRDTYPARNGSNDYSDKSAQRGRNFESGGYNNRTRYENDRTFEPSNDTNYDRSDRFDRGFERSNDRPFERSNDRGFERSNDRGYDRQNDRGFDRSSNDRGFDRPNNRFGNRNNRYNDRNDDYDGQNRGFDRHDSNDRSYGRRTDDRRYAEMDSKYQNRNFTERKADNRREFGGGFERRKDDSHYDRSPPPERESAEEQPKERRKLQLIPRSKPLQESVENPSANSAIFGDAKPVNTAAREKEIEQKLLKEKEDNDKKRENASSAGSGSDERIRRISAGSNVSGNSRSRKGSDSGPSLSHKEESRDFDNYKNNGMNRNSSNRQRKTSERSNASSDSAPKYILSRNKPESRYVPPRTQSQPFRGGANSESQRNNNNNINRRKDRERGGNRFDNYRPPRLSQSKSDEEEEKKVAYMTANKFAHLTNEDYDEDDDRIGGASD